MEEFALCIKLLIGGLFLSSGWSKVRKMDEHEVILREYQLLPVSWVPLFARVEVAVELIIGIALLLGLFQPITALATAGMLLIYTGAVGINLLRGRNEISCGCGGAAGNHQLSWTLVLRNLVFLPLILWAGYQNPVLGSLQAAVSSSVGWQQAFGLSFVLMTLISLFLLVTGSAVQALFAIKKRIRVLFHS